MSKGHLWEVLYTIIFQKVTIRFKVIHKPTKIKSLDQKQLVMTCLGLRLSWFPSGACIAKTLCHFRCLLATVNISRYFSSISKKEQYITKFRGKCLFRAGILRNLVRKGGKNNTLFVCILIDSIVSNIMLLLHCVFITEIYVYSARLGRKWHKTSVSTEYCYTVIKSPVTFRKEHPQKWKDCKNEVTTDRKLLQEKLPNWLY